MHLLKDIYVLAFQSLKAGLEIKKKIYKSPFGD